jgi:hypothetical protein
MAIWYFFQKYPMIYLNILSILGNAKFIWYYMTKMEYSTKKKREDVDELGISSSNWEISKRNLQTTKNFYALMNRINVLTH